MTSINASMIETSKLKRGPVSRPLAKAVDKKSISDKIANLKRLEKKRQKEFDTAQAKLWKKQGEIAKKIIDETTKRNTQFLEKLWKEKSLTEKTVKVHHDHRGVAILINKHYKPTFGDLEIFEITRGI